MEIIKSTVYDTHIICKFAWSSNTEQAFSSVVNSLLQINSFVIKLTSIDVTFNLNGKCFSIPVSLVQNFTDVFVVEDKTALDDGTLDSSELVTLILTNKRVPNSFQILEKRETSWQVPVQSQIRISKTNEIIVDDGEL